MRYRKPGFISAQRQVQVPWNDIAVVDTVSLVFEDAAATVVKFDGSPATVVTHRSREVSDSSGTRAATMVFTGDNKAYLTDKAGNKILDLKSITTRATEFTTPESMPAKLPPNSGYTYCVELSVDGAERVKFAKPVVMWVDNFLGFSVGGVVPVGYYDRDRGLWVPADNGRVVRLLDRNGDGVVDALDADGDGQPDDLNGNGLYEDEVTGLTNPLQYPPGPPSGAWRSPILPPGTATGRMARLWTQFSPMLRGSPMLTNSRQRKKPVRPRSALSLRNEVASSTRTFPSPAPA